MNTISSTRMNAFTNRMLGFSIEDTIFSEIQISAVDFEKVCLVVSNLDEPLDDAIFTLTQVFTFSRKKDNRWSLEVSSLCFVDDSSSDSINDIEELLRTIQDYKLVQYNVSTFSEKDLDSFMEKLKARAEFK